MPTYQYRCTSCGSDLEAVQKFSDDPLTVCPDCGGDLRKVFSAVGVVFKGSGFYATDSRSKAKPAATKPTPVESTPKSEPSKAKPEASKKSTESTGSSSAA